MKNRDIVLLSLGSSDCFGTPLKTPIVFDVLTKREMKKHNIDFYNARDLTKMVQHKRFAPVKDDNRQFVMKTVHKLGREITYPQMITIFDEAGIDEINAVAYYKESQDREALRQQIDVYDALLDFVRNNRGKDISVDELPILMNPESKIIFLKKRL